MITFQQNCLYSTVIVYWLLLGNFNYYLKSMIGLCVEEIFSSWFECNFACPPEDHHRQYGVECEFCSMGLFLVFLMVLSVVFSTIAIYFIIKMYAAFSFNLELLVAEFFPDHISALIIHQLKGDFSKQLYVVTLRKQRDNQNCYMHPIIELSKVNPNDIMEWRQSKRDPVVIEVASHAEVQEAALNVEVYGTYFMQGRLTSIAYLKADEFTTDEDESTAEEAPTGHGAN